jgi:hypothetical protein
MRVTHLRVQNSILAYPFREWVSGEADRCRFFTLKVGRGQGRLRKQRRQRRQRETRRTRGQRERRRKKLTGIGLFLH